MTRSSTARDLLPMVLDGRAQQAASLALATLDGMGATRHGEPAVELSSLAADLLLAQDCAEDAEDLYRQALVAAATSPRGQVRVISCRNIGMLSLYQRRYGAAANSFQRVTEDDAATLAQQVEALAGMALTHHALGRNELATQALDEAAARLDGTSADGLMPAVASLRLFVRVVRAELAVQYTIRTSGALADHVFWQSDTVYAGARRDESGLLGELNACQAAAVGHALLSERLAQLAMLVRAGMGQTRGLAAVHDHLAWLRRMHLAAPEREARLECALVAIATNQPGLARSLLEPFGTRQDEGPQRWNFELSYCRAKLCEMTGQSEECHRHYQRYALESARCLRSETQTVAPVAATKGRVAETRDEAELALPAKYRRAYRYLLSQMDRADLSVREIAEHIGVTERAVQSAFRTHLGMTPVEVLRRCRVERIRDDLLSAEGCGPTVIETAARWGIRNRSTLVSSYRKHFRETPADTLARREPPAALHA
ncbi:helix-turn-helix transcriptional regulator [Piscinibacter gummiphilus]|nr:helix-turn-helix transcriptional regulator [Piscinibacter gummiphilus]